MHYAFMLNLISHLPIRSYVEQQSLMMMQQFTDADDDDDDGNDDDDDKVSVMEFERSTMLPQITKTMWNNKQQSTTIQHTVL